ncbi:MAG: TolC family protein [Selenomonadaceae bacterium]|nr:TolC family protein [Selenomonadaceae bacterium]
MRSLKNFAAALAATCVLLPNTTFAAESLALSLDQAVELALKNNRLIEQSTEEREAARWNLSAVRRSGGLMLSWSASSNRIGGRYYNGYRENHSRYNWYYSYYYNMTGIKDSNYNPNKYPSYFYENANTINLQMNLYSGGRLENQRKSARYNLNAADLTLENSRQTVKYRAAAAYYQVLQSKNLVEVQEQAVKLLNEHLRTVQIQYEVGTVAKSDLLATSVQLSNVEQALTTAQGNYQTSVAQLNNVLGLPVDTEVATFTTDNITHYDLSEQECLDYAIKHRPDGKAAAYAVKSAEANTSATKSGYRPTVSAVASGSIVGEGFMKSDHTAERWSVGLQMQWNIFDNGVTGAQVNQSKAMERRAQSIALQQLETIQLEVHSAYINLTTAEKNIATTAAAVSKAEEEFSIAQVRYIEGVDTNLNVMNAQEKVVQARNNYYTALYAYNTSRAQLEKAMGVPVLIDAELYDKAAQSGISANKSLEAAQISEQSDKLDTHTEILPLPFADTSENNSAE